jgi:hypothetical protein
MGHIAEASRPWILAHGTRTLTEGHRVRRTPDSGELNLDPALKRDYCYQHDNGGDQSSPQ